jgi:hypothetical protein
MAVGEPDPIRRRALLAADLQYLTLTFLRADRPTPDMQHVADLGMHVHHLRLPVSGDYAARHLCGHPWRGIGGQWCRVRFLGYGLMETCEPDPSSTGGDT